MNADEEIVRAGKEMGPNDCNGPSDPLHEALINFWLNGVADESAGDVDTTGHVFRVGRHTVETDGYGFTRLTSFETEEGAEKLIEERSAEMVEE